MTPVGPSAGIILLCSTSRRSRGWTATPRCSDFHHGLPGPGELTGARATLGGLLVPRVLAAGRSTNAPRGSGTLGESHDLMIFASGLNVSVPTVCCFLRAVRVLRRRALFFASGACSAPGCSRRAPRIAVVLRVLRVLRGQRLFSASSADGACPPRPSAPSADSYCSPRPPRSPRTLWRISASSGKSLSALLHNASACLNCADAVRVSPSCSAANAIA